MPESVEFLPKSSLLSFEEMARVARVAAGLGVDKVRLTGGEPLVRRNLAELIRQIVAIPGIKDVGLTTNGILLAPLANDLWSAGLRRINVSLDTMDPGRFLEITRRPGLEQVIAGILAAKAAGFAPVKLNAVIIKGVNEADIVPLAEFGREHGVELRFIEYMPLDADNHWERGKVVFAQEIIDVISAEITPLLPIADPDPRAPALDYDYADGSGRVGFIASVSRPFCSNCNRMRLTAEGKLRNCLFALDETDLRPLLRSDAPDQAIADALKASVRGKWEGHEINTARFVKPEWLMHSIGG